MQLVSKFQSFFCWVEGSIKLLLIHTQLFKGPQKAKIVLGYRNTTQFGVLTLPAFQPYYKLDSNQNCGAGQ